MVSWSQGFPRYKEVPLYIKFPLYIYLHRKGRGLDELTRLSHAPLNPHGIFLGPLVHLFLHLGLFLRVHGPEAALPGRPVPIRGLRLLDLRKALVERQIVPHWILDFQKTKVEGIFLKHYLCEFDKQLKSINFKIWRNCANGQMG